MSRRVGLRHIASVGGKFFLSGQLRNVGVTIYAPLGYLTQSGADVYGETRSEVGVNVYGETRSEVGMAVYGETSSEVGVDIQS